MIGIRSLSLFGEITIGLKMKPVSKEHINSGEGLEKHTWIPCSRQ
jgi:hypothetical protein